MRFLGLAALLLLVASTAAHAAESAPDLEQVPTRSGTLFVARIAGSINPASSDYLQRAIRQSEEEGAAALLLELDTPGGLVASTKDIIQAMLESRVPVVVFVYPRGSWAGSAGVFITMAAHVAAMSPGSSIGAAHPVGLGGPSPQPDQDEERRPDPAAQKAEQLLASFIEAIADERKRNVEWARRAVRESVAATATEALALGVVEIVASSRADLLEQLEVLPFDFEGERVRLALVGAPTRDIEMTLMTRIMNVIVDPNVAVLLLLAGLLGLYIEFNNPGVILPGVAGGICLVLALIAMQILPFSWVGLLLILLGIALFVSEVFVTSYGLLFAAGVVSLLLGGSMLFDRPEVSDLNVSFWPVLVPAVGGMALFGGLVVFAVGRSFGRKQQSGVSELVGMVGTTTTALEPTGTVFVRGEYWRARGDQPIPVKTRVEITAVEGLELRVRPAAAD
jgi:membrane-bound serine protease (ClpP class)